MYRLKIMDKEEQIILEYSNLKLIAKNNYVKILRLEVDPKYSVDVDHPDYVEFYIFKSGIVKERNFEWHKDKKIGSHYTGDDCTKYELLECERVDA